MRRTFSLSAFAALMIMALPAGAQESQPLLDKGAWQSYVGKDSTGKVCYMSSFPGKSEGKYTRRGNALIVVAHRPGRPEFHVISLTMGYTVKKGSKVTVSIDGKIYELNPVDSTAWTATSQEDKALAQAMRSGAHMVVKGVSSRGTSTTDTYSLSGFTAVHNAINEACGAK